MGNYSILDGEAGTKPRPPALYAQRQGSGSDAWPICMECGGVSEVASGTMIGTREDAW